MEKLLADDRLARRDLERVYEGLFLSAFTRFEVLLEDLFFGLLVGRVSCYSCDSYPRVNFQSEKVARQVILRERRYLDWLPYGKTEELAKSFFRGGRPFTRLDDGEKSKLQTSLFIRNAIAHKSTYSSKIFTEKVLGSTPLAPRERTPAGFLRSQYRINQTRFQLYMNDVLAVSKKVCHR
ncbi:MAG TPA: hypothetical protein VFQ41_20445 [Candidatus Angelobacter sp.]|nr:hypothetical protein [Candidatus Angelobacter sp.]